jgi:TPR repeat protein
MYFRKKDFEQALYWLQKSTAQGYARSIEYLKNVLRRRSSE